MRAAASIANVGPTAVLVTAIVGVEMPARDLVRGVFCTKGRLAVKGVGLGGHALPGGAIHYPVALGMGYLQQNGQTCDI